MASKNKLFGMLVFGLAAGLLLDGCPGQTTDKDDDTGKLTELIISIKLTAGKTAKGGSYEKQIV